MAVAINPTPTPTPDANINVSEYSTSCSLAAQIAVFGAKVGRDQRELQRQGWEKSMKLADAEHKNLLAQADESRASATARLVGSVVGGATGIVGSGLQFRALGKARSELDGQQSLLNQRQKEIDASNLSPQEKQAAMGNEVQKTYMENNRIQTEVQYAQAIGALFSSAGQMAKGTGDYVAGMHDAQRTELEAEKKLISAAAQVNGQQTQVAGENASKLLDIAGQVTSSVQSPRFA